MSTGRITPQLRRRHIVRTAAAALSVAIGVGFALPAGASTSGIAERVSSAQEAPSTVEVPTNVLEQVGLASGVTGPTLLKGEPALMFRGKPLIVAVDAGFCPYCAVSRWDLEIALAQFGSLTAGAPTKSSATDVDPGTASYSLRGSHYTSAYLSFQAFDAVGPGFGNPTNMTSQEKAAYDRFDKAPYTSEAGSIPFVDVDNRFLVLGASASVGALKGLSVTQIAHDLSNPSSPVARALDGGANYLIASFCSLLGNGSAAICASPMVARAEAQWARSQPTTTTTVPTSTTSTLPPVSSTTVAPTSTTSSSTTTTALNGMPVHA